MVQFMYPSVSLTPGFTTVDALTAEASQASFFPDLCSLTGHRETCPTSQCQDTMKSPSLDAELRTPLGLASHNVIRDVMFMALRIKCLRQAGIYARYLLDRCARLVSLDKLA